jgi:predicted RecA/RadA family phage recombinase
MKNFIQDGEYMPLPAPYARNSGEGALIGALFGVAVSNVANGANGVFHTKGVYTLVKDTAASSGGAVGTKAYWIAADKEVTAASAGNVLIGTFAATCADGDATAKVRLGVVG